MKEFLDKVAIGAKIKYLRKQKELNQLELASKIGIKQPNLSAIESGKRPLGKKIAKKLADVLEVDYRNFL